MPEHRTYAEDEPESESWDSVCLGRNRALTRIKELERGIEDLCVERNEAKADAKRAEKERDEARAKLAEAQRGHEEQVLGPHGLNRQIYRISVEREEARAKLAEAVTALDDQGYQEIDCSECERNQDTAKAAILAARRILDEEK